MSETPQSLYFPDEGDDFDPSADMQKGQESVEALLAIIFPAGSIIATGRAAAPTGFLLCDGSAVSRTDYARLFAAIGTVYGVGDGAKTFNVPDLRGRVPIGVDGPAGRLSANDALGKSGGEEKHVLATGEIPAHAHAAGTLGTANQQYEPEQVLPKNFNQYFGSDTFTAVSGWQPNTNAIGGNTAAAGGGGSHNNLQPYQIVNFLIKV